MEISPIIDYFKAHDNHQQTKTFQNLSERENQIYSYHCIVILGKFETSLRLSL